MKCLLFLSISFNPNEASRKINKYPTRNNQRLSTTLRNPYRRLQMNTESQCQPVAPRIRERNSSPRFRCRYTAFFIILRILTLKTIGWIRLSNTRLTACPSQGSSPAQFLTVSTINGRGTPFCGKRVGTTNHPVLVIICRIYRRAYQITFIPSHFVLPQRCDSENRRVPYPQKLPNFRYTVKP